MAAGENLYVSQANGGSYNQWHNYQLNKSDTEWDMSTFVWETSDANSQIANTGKIYINGQTGTKLNVTDDPETDDVESVTINTVVGGGAFEKTGDGILTLTRVSVDGLPESATISAGTLKVYTDGGATSTFNNTNGFVAGTVDVAGGATLQLAQKDALGYGTVWGGNYTDTVNLNGKDAENKATLQVDAETTLSTNVNLKGYSTISGDGTIHAYGGTITATGTENTISTTLMTRMDMNVNVTGKDDQLTITGKMPLRQIC